MRAQPFRRDGALTAVTEVGIVVSAHEEGLDGAFALPREHALSLGCPPHRAVVLVVSAVGYAAAVRPFADVPLTPDDVREDGPWIRGEFSLYLDLGGWPELGAHVSLASYLSPPEVLRA